MGASATVNKLTVVHKDSGGVSTAFPDTCKTPSPAGPVPIPYPNVAMSSDTADGTKKVKVDGNPIMHKGSNFSMSTGDEAGSAQGVVSNKIKGKAYPKMYSFDVKAEGNNVFRQTDIMLQNGGSPTNTPPGPEVQAPKVAQAEEGPPPKITKVSWSKSELKCGDPVDLEIETENCKDGDGVYANVKRKTDGHHVAMLLRPVQGNKAKIQWITKTGPDPEGPKVRLDCEGAGQGDPVKASPELTLKVPDYDIEVERGRRRIPSVSLVPQPWGARWQQGPKTWGWPYGYDAEITEGCLRVTCKITLLPQDGMVLTDRHRRRVEDNIKRHWNGSYRYREHRKECKRGKDCSCKGGCCVFPVVFNPIVVPTGGYVDVKIHPGSPCDYGFNPDRSHKEWWTSGNWFGNRCRHAPSVSRGMAHEFGHLLGLYDEYYGGAVWYPQDASGALAGAPPHFEDPSSLMGRGTEIKPRYLDAYHNWFCSSVAESYVLERI